MADVLPIDIAGERLNLHADRALHWPTRRSLLIADLHLGKGDTLRARGIPVPTGGSADDLARLGTLIRLLAVERLWILGDLLHGPRTAGSWRDHWDAFRREHVSLDIRLVAGNHDGAAARSGLDISLHAGEITHGPFLLAHQPSGKSTSGPAGLPAERPRIGGHLHPVVRLPGLRGRFPAFVITKDQIVLPAFSTFSGGSEAWTGARRIVCVGERMVDVPPRRQL